MQSVILKSTEFRGAGWFEGSFGEGVLVSQIRSWEIGEALASILIDENARPGRRTIVVRVNRKDLVFRDAFRVTPHLLRLEEIKRESGSADQIVRLTLLHVPSNATAAQFTITLDPRAPEPRVTVHPFFTAFAKDRLTMKFFVPRESLLGRKTHEFQVSVHLTTALGDTSLGSTTSISLPPALRLLPGPPLVVYLGQSATVMIPCDNASVTDEPVRVSFGPGIVVKSSWVQDDNWFGAGIQVAPDAKTGPRTLTVRAGAATLQSQNALVIEPEPLWRFLERHINALRKWYEPRD